jgi:hypothetical protein
LDARKIESAEIVPASRKLGKPDAAAIAKAASVVYVAKGKKVAEWKPAGKAGADLLAAMLGPTGNLRAPCLRVGKTVIVGFNDELYARVFG